MEVNLGARSGDVKKGRSAERRCQKGPERGATFTPGRAPTVLYALGTKYRSTEFSTKVTHIVFVPILKVGYQILITITKPGRDNIKA